MKPLTNTPILAIQNLSKTYDRGKTHALQNVSFAVERGEFVVVIGSSGAGGLLHDIGKVIQRAHGARVPHSKYDADWLSEHTPVTQSTILDQVRYHHAREIRQTKQSISPLAYIAYIADNIASGIDRRSTEASLDEEYAQTFKGFDSKVPLQSVFKLLHRQSTEALANETANTDNAYYIPSTRVSADAKRLKKAKPPHGGFRF